MSSQESAPTPVATELRIQVPGVQSLAWDGDALVDWVAGGRRYGLSGDITEASVRYAYSFDAAVALEGSALSVIYTRCGTKGLVLQGGDVVREINRSFYHADVYEHPIALFRLASGREVLAHCPESYCQLDIEDAITGELLTRSTSRKPADFFHSRLAASPDGRHLVSAGWLWHPIDDVSLYDVEQALADPSHLDGFGLGLGVTAEESSATFFPDGRLAVALQGEIDADDTAPQAELRICDAGRSMDPMVLSPAGRMGTIAAIGNDHVLALFGHPRLLDMRTGREVLSWPQLKSGTQTTSILMAGYDVPPTAVDAAGKRFALADAQGITVIQIAP